MSGINIDADVVQRAYAIVQNFRNFVRGSIVVPIGADISDLVLFFAMELASREKEYDTKLKALEAKMQEFGD